MHLIIKAPSEVLCLYMHMLVWKCIAVIYMAAFHFKS